MDPAIRRDADQQQQRRTGRGGGLHLPTWPSLPESSRPPQITCAAERLRDLVLHMADYYCDRKFFD
eukprot:206388-Heterocapsa_arctica.AAC.1